jgi:hypothetical protein
MEYNGLVVRDQVVGDAVRADARCPITTGAM